MRVLVVNARSSSLKVDLVDGGGLLMSYDGLPEAATQVDPGGAPGRPRRPDLIEPVVLDFDVEQRARELWSWRRCIN